MTETSLTQVQNEFIKEIAETYKFTNPKDVEAIKNVAFPTLSTLSQLRVAFSVSQKYDLDPMAKEIYAYVKDNKLVLIVASAGFLKIARKQDGYKQIISQAVFAGDDFEIDMVNNAVKHTIKPKERKPGEAPIGAYAILRMEGKEDQIKWVYWDEYAPGKESAYSPWSKQKSAMISKCAVAVLCREAFGLSGLYGEEEMDDSQAEFKEHKRKKAIEDTRVPEMESVEAEVEEDVPTEEESYISKVRGIVEKAKTEGAILGVKAEFYDRVCSETYTEQQAKGDYLLLLTKLKNGNGKTTD